jgi:hypothetical protein
MTDISDLDVFKVQDQPEERFEINDARYLHMVQDPAQANAPGYVGTEMWQTFDETALRAELASLGADVERIKSLIEQARANFVGRVAE